MKKHEILNLQKKGASKINGALDSAVSAVVVVAVVAALSPTIFADLLNINSTAGAPAWLQPVLFIIVGVGILYLIYDMFLKKR